MNSGKPALRLRNPRLSCFGSHETAPSFCFVAFSRENRRRGKTAQSNSQAREARRALFQKTL
jgi:hypothetical protein